MSGGIAYVLDEDDTFKSRCNMAMVELEPVPEEGQVAEQEFGHYNDLEAHGRVDVMAGLTSKDAERLRMLISNHARYTNSKRAAGPCCKSHQKELPKAIPRQQNSELEELAFPSARQCPNNLRKPSRFCLTEVFNGPMW
jgi:glutamate synthase (NADPH/NADH) large chain